MALVERIESAFSSHDSGSDARCATGVEILTVVDRDEYEHARRDPAVLALYERAAKQAAGLERSDSR